MKLSYKLLKRYIDFDYTPERLAEILTDIGLEAEGVEPVETVKGGLEGLVVGEVIFKDKHPNADRLSVTKVDIGNGVVLDIVCGAANVAAGQKVIVATEGAKLYPAEGEPFTIKKGKIRGEASEGMICAEDEIGMGTDHSGIIVLPADTPVGMKAATYYQVDNDYIIEIGLTPNRSDAICHLGVAADLDAWRQVNEGRPSGLLKPSVDAFAQTGDTVSVGVSVESTTACPRYAGVVLTGLHVQESPAWLKNALLAIGVRPINNIVDATNFVLHELGQPLHAFDLTEVKGSQVIVKQLPSGTPFVTLDGIERKLHEEDLMICNGAGEPMCIAGVFGGLNSGVKESTTAIFLESAHFAAKSVRRTATRLGLRTDASAAFEKGTDPNLPVYALQRAALLITELAGGHIASPVTDLVFGSLAAAEVKVRYTRVQNLIGKDIAPETIRQILSALNMATVAEDSESITVAVPTNKADVTREADVIEEILRIYGFNKIEISHKLNAALSYTPQPDPHRLRNLCSDLLVSQGFHEMMAVSLNPSRYYKEIVAVEESSLVYINNTSNQHLDVMRPMILMGMLEAIEHNQNRQHTDLSLFEFGRVYSNTEKGYQESQRLAMVLTGRRFAESWINKQQAQSDFYTVKAYTTNLLLRLGIAGYRETVLENHPSLAWGLQLSRGNQQIGTIGMVKKSVLKKMDIRNPVFYADLNWDVILQLVKTAKVEYKKLSKFPVVRRDLALVIDKSVPFGDIATLARKQSKALLQSCNLFDVYENSTQLGENKKSYAISFVFGDDTRTLKDQEVEEQMNKLIQAFETQLSAQVRK